MQYLEQYTFYKELCETGYQTIYTKDINKDNIDIHFDSIINILKDGIETEEVQSMMVHIIFEDDEDIDLSLFDYVINLMMWQLRTGIDKPILSVHLAFFEDITKRGIKEYIDNSFIDKYRKEIPFIKLNQLMDDAIGKFRELRPFQMFLANTLNLEDTIELMEKYPDFNETVHFNTEGIPLEDLKDVGMQATNLQINYIKNSDHCLRDSFRTGEAISPKQYKEVGVNIGPKPNGLGSVFPHPIKHSFMNGGLQSAEEICIESSVGRVAQILEANNVGDSGAFARKLELNNQDTFLNPDPDYICDTRNFEEVEIDSSTKLQLYDLRYYRENPLGVDKLCEAKNCKHLIGKKLYFRSPMTCASAARGQGICYKCYGDLAYANHDINIGQIAAESLSSIYTQILLSAKHLLESLVVKMKWTKEFYDLFDTTFNTIALKSANVYKGYKLAIDEDIKFEEEIDEFTYNGYINSFIIINPNGEEVRIHTEESDNLYFVPEFYEYYMNIRGQLRDLEEDERLEFDMVPLMDFPALFLIEVRNNELSKTMDQIKKLIDNKAVISKYDRNSILKSFTDTNILGGIKINAVHYEVLLMNQLRAIDDELESPDWTIPNQQCQIFTLGNSLSNNKSITVRLQSANIPRILNNPKNRFTKKPSIMDLYYMEQPQEYLNPDFVSDEYREKEDEELDVEEPVTFDNPKVHVGRRKK